MKYVKIHSVCEFCAKKGYLNEMYVRKEIKFRLKNCKSVTIEYDCF